MPGKHLNQLPLHHQAKSSKGPPPQPPPDPIMPPKPPDCTSPNGSHGPKQGDPCQISQKTHTSLTNPTKQALTSSHIPPDPQATPHPQKCTIPNMSYGLNQRNPWPKYQSSPTPTSNPQTPQIPKKYSSPKGIQGLNRGNPWQKSKPAPTPPPRQIKKGSFHPIPLQTPHNTQKMQEP